jgi:rod shape determining protein RodA
MLIFSLLLTSLGIVVIYSSSQILAIQQIIFTILGVLIYFFLRFIDYRSISSVSKYLYYLILVLLVIVFLLGVETRGSLRWIPLGLFNLQPSEFSKPVLILCLASFWSLRTATWGNILKSLGILLPFAGLIFKQPDLGTTIALLFIWIVMLVASNISLLKLLVVGLTGSFLAPLFWFFLRSYQKQRFLSFISPNQDPQGIGYNVIQSMIAVGSGEFTGRGLGRGTQSRLRFLPEFRTDFIFASIAEELGLIGSLIVLALYFAVFFFLFRALSKVEDRFGELIIVGVASMLFIQIVVNIGMNAGLLPITGITLPLLSYGGSSVISVFISLGLVSSVERLGGGRKEYDGIFSLG